jgi:hypothetical protein
MIFLFAARSVKENASLITFSDPSFFESLIAISRRDLRTLFTSAFFFEDLSALFAVFVTGIALTINDRE